MKPNLITFPSPKRIRVKRGEEEGEAKKTKGNVE